MDLLYGNPQMFVCFCVPQVQGALRPAHGPHMLMAHARLLALAGSPGAPRACSLRLSRPAARGGGGALLLKYMYVSSCVAV
jgi:hypothetical protein